jgi:ATP/ADP translocase
MPKILIEKLAFLRFLEKWHYRIFYINFSLWLAYVVSKTFPEKETRASFPTTQSNKLCWNEFRTRVLPY